MPSRHRFRPAPGQPMLAHVTSRIVNRAFWFDEEAKRVFRGLMRKYEGFGGLRVITYCLMSNHFHLLVEVPARPEQMLDEEAMLAHLEATLGKRKAQEYRDLFGLWRSNGCAGEIPKMLAALWKRMFDLSAFVQALKLGFSKWYNRKHGRKGTLWEERFASVLVEGAGNAVATMAAYIDLNPVRAGLACDPKEYQWSGYGEAVGGGRMARRGIAMAVGALRRQKLGDAAAMRWDEAQAVYRKWIYWEGQEVKADGTTPGRKGFAVEQIEAVLKAGGKLALADLVRLRVRHFTAGAVLGSREFVDEIFAGARERFGPKRTSGARRLRILERDAGLYALRDLRNDV
ncbi:MAG: transposase [Verrucomicrobiales bacterium]|nr:transposase [Verrucomicrobiales bacterium]